MEETQAQAKHNDEHTVLINCLIWYLSILYYFFGKKCFDFIK